MGKLLDAYPYRMVLSTNDCIPCKQLKSYAKANNLGWEFVYQHVRPDLFKSLGITSVPTMIEEISPNEYKILGVGLVEIHRLGIMTHVNTDKEEEE